MQFAVIGLLNSSLQSNDLMTSSTWRHRQIDSLFFTSIGSKQGVEPFQITVRVQV